MLYPSEPLVREVLSRLSKSCEEKSKGSKKMEVACLMIDNGTTRVRVQRHAARSVITVEYSANLPIRQTEACASYVTMGAS